MHTKLGPLNIIFQRGCALNNSGQKLFQLGRSLNQNIYCKGKIRPAEISKIGSSHPEVFLGKGVPKTCCKFTREHPCRNAISTKLISNFIETSLQHGCSSVNLLYLFRRPFLKNTSGWMLKYSFVRNCMGEGGGSNKVHQGKNIKIS